MIAGEQNPTQETKVTASTGSDSQGPVSKGKKASFMQKGRKMMY